MGSDYVGWDEEIPNLRTKSEWQFLIAEALSLHPHCNDCVIRDCNYKQECCDMIECQCGARFHVCKRDDHQELCPATPLVPCLNANYGCPLLMPRHSRAAHLETCPASVVVCCFEWGRIPQEASIAVADQLDTQFAFRDQKYLEDALFPLSRLAIDKIPLQAKVKQYLKDHEKRMDIVKHELKERPVDPSKPWPLIVNSILEFGTRFHICATDKYMYICGKEVRRDMYSWHFKNIHSDIMCGLNDWLIQKCPLQEFGCTYSRRRVYPDIPTASLVFDPESEDFAVKYETNIITSHTPERSHLCLLPCEMLELVCQYLDPQSIGNLSLTCRQLRDFCSSVLLVRQGIVNLVWTKTDTAEGQYSMQKKWMINKKSWKFPHYFTPIRKWGVHQHPPMAHHMAECQKYQRCFHKTPYNLLNELPAIPPKILQYVELACQEEKQVEED